MTGNNDNNNNDNNNDNDNDNNNSNKYIYVSIHSTLRSCRLQLLALRCALFHKLPQTKPTNTAFGYDSLS